jgi:hypothetical protein
MTPPPASHTPPLANALDQLLHAGLRIPVTDERDPEQPLVHLLLDRIAGRRAGLAGLRYCGGTGYEAYGCDSSCRLSES